MFFDGKFFHRYHSNYSPRLNIFITMAKKILEKFVKDLFKECPDFDVTLLLPELILQGVITGEERTAIQQTKSKADKILVLLLL